MLNYLSFSCVFFFILALFRPPGDQLNEDPYRSGSEPLIIIVQVKNYVCKKHNGMSLRSTGKDFASYAASCKSGKISWYRYNLTNGEYPLVPKLLLCLSITYNQCCGSVTIFFESGSYFPPSFGSGSEKNSYGSGSYLVKSFGSSFGSDPKHSLFHNANDFK
jgi:hypothetical protein